MHSNIHWRFYWRDGNTAERWCADPWIKALAHGSWDPSGIRAVFSSILGGYGAFTPQRHSRKVTNNKSWFQDCSKQHPGNSAQCLFHLQSAGNEVFAEYQDHRPGPGQSHLAFSWPHTGSKAVERLATYKPSLLADSKALPPRVFSSKFPSQLRRDQGTSRTNTFHVWELLCWKLASESRQCYLAVLGRP